MSDSGWRFDGNYRNLEQVADFMPAFKARLAELEAAREPLYNDRFAGHIPGIEGPHESKAIYLLILLERQQNQAARIEALLADGYEHVTKMDGVRKYAHIVVFPSRPSGGSGWQEFDDARLVPRDGEPYGVLPKGKRVNGFTVFGMRILAK